MPADASLVKKVRRRCLRMTILPVDSDIRWTFDPIRSRTRNLTRGYRPHPIHDKISHVFLRYP